MTQSKEYNGNVLGRMYEGQECSAARALEVVGERWSLLILRDAMFRGSTRFSQFQQTLEIATNILSKRLGDFVAAGLMEERPCGPRADDREYVLTPMGLDFMPAVIALTEWGDRWVAPGPVVFEHRDCGGRVEAPLVCKECDRSVRPGQVLARRRGESRRPAAPAKRAAKS
jgi:DNA-binding HxlR family transcriptional regulator